MHRLFYLSSLCIAVTVYAPLTHADSVYVDLSNTEEITVSSDQIEGSHVLEIQSYDEHEKQANSTRVNTHNINMQTLPFHQEVLVAANRTALEPALIHAVIDVESKHNPTASSKKGAYGLMQLMPATALRFGLTKLKQGSHQQNILVGARYLKEMLVLFDGDVELALAAYNAGPGAVKKYHHSIPPYQETKLYVPKVLKLYRRYTS